MSDLVLLSLVVRDCCCCFYCHTGALRTTIPHCVILQPGLEQLIIMLLTAAAAVANSIVFSGVVYDFR